MQHGVAIQSGPAARGSWACNLYLGLAGLILVGILAAGMLIGPSLFSGTKWGRDAHLGVGTLVFFLTLLLPLAGLLARLPRGMIVASVGLFVLALVQVITASMALEGHTLPAAVHPTNAMLMFGLTVLLVAAGWRRRGQRAGAGDETPPS